MQLLGCINRNLLSYGKGSYETTFGDNMRWLPRLGDYTLLLEFPFHWDIFSFQIILFPTSQQFVFIQKNVTMGDMTSINNCFCKVTSRPCTHASKDYFVFSRWKALCFLLLKELSPYGQTCSNSIKWNKRRYLLDN